MERLERRRLLASTPAIDVTFGAGGFSNTPNIWGDVYAINQLENGKIVMVGTGNPLLTPIPGFADDPFVARFNADGSPDSSFDTDGILTLPDASSGSFLSDATVAPDGKFYHVAQSRLHRFNVDGTLDNAFGANGVVTLSLPSSSLRQVIVQPDGKIIVSYGSYGFTAVPGKAYLARLNSDGTVDNSYRGGIPATPQDTGLSSIDQLLVGPDGKLYVAAFQPVGDDYKTVIARYTTTGAPDTTFGGGDGLAEAGTAVDARPRFNRMAIDSAGSIAIVSQVSTASYQTILLSRLTSAGAHDPTFGGGDGEYIFAQGVLPSPVSRDILIQSDGKIVIANQGDFPTEMQLIRFNTNGTLDTTYGESGFFNPGRYTFDTNRMVFDNDGNILAAGRFTSDLSAELAITRVVPTVADTTLDPDGTLYVNGTSAPDNISFSRSGSQLIVNRNGADTTYSSAAVSRLAIFGNGGNDIVSIPFAIASSILGGNGDDSVTVGDGNVTFDGEDGNDTIVAGNGNHLIRTHYGSDHITTGVGNDTIDAGGDYDTIITGAGDDLVNADGRYNQGNDAVTTGGGNDTIYAGNGVDTVHAGGGNDLITAYEHVNATIGEKVKEYYGEDGNDTIYGGQYSDYIDGGAGNDSIRGGFGHDEIVGGAGDDLIYGDEGGYTGHTSFGYDSILGGDGDDWIDAEDGGNSVFGGSGNDKIFAGAGYDYLWGEDGSDKIYGSDGIDSLYGNGGNDTLYGNAQSDHIRGNGGRDRMYGNGGNDRLYGGASGDFIYGQAGNDQILGEGGNDRLYGDDGFSDTLRGGAGDDVFITLDNVADALFGDGGRDSFNGDDNDSIASVEVAL